MFYAGGMSRPQYVEVTCKSALNRVQGMPFKWSLNPYAGCVHACVYCYARAHYATAGHGDAGREFETRILVKTNFAEVLRRELGRPRWGFEMVSLGTVTDCYQPAEGRYKITRAALAALRDVANPVGMVTKSPLVLRDIDILASLAQVAKVRIFFTITTVDLDLWRRLEPGTANPFKRLEVMRRLNAAGVPAGVLLAPILPGITDSAASLDAVAQAAAEHNAAYFGTSTLRLAPIVKEEYLGFVDDEFPELVERYERAYFGRHAPNEYQRALDERVERIRARYGFVAESMRQTALTPPATSVPPPGPTFQRVGPQLLLPMVQ
jgi:DNA repair photolyase